MSDCIFCEIIAGRSPVSKIYEDDLVLALMTIEPVNPGHAMVIPKEHSEGLSDMAQEIGAHLFKITQRVAEAIKQSDLRCEGINLFLADGKAAFQDVFHTHMHVFPRFKGDPFKIDADWDVNPSREELDAAASKIAVSYSKLYDQDL